MEKLNAREHENYLRSQKNIMQIFLEAQLDNIENGEKAYFVEEVLRNIHPDIREYRDDINRQIADALGLTPIHSPS